MQSQQPTNPSNTQTQPDPTANATESAAAKPPAKQWPAALAIVTSWLLPATTTARTAHLSLFRAYGAHLIGLILLPAAFIGVSASSPWRSQDTSVLLEIMNAAVELVESLITSPIRTLLFIGGPFLVLEGVSAVIVLVTIPFGARNEPLRATIRHALRRCWLHTAQVAIVIVIVGSLSNAVDNAMRTWNDRAEAAFIDSIDPSGPFAGVDLSSSSPLAREYWQLRSAFVEKFPRPWFIRYGDFIRFLSITIPIFWFFWSLFRGIAAPRQVLQAEPEAPLCRWCGYNLTGVPPDGRCSECGRPYGESFDENVDPGAPWEHRRRIGRLRAYSHTAWAGVAHIRDFARKLRLTPVAPGILRFLVLHLVACQVVAMAGFFKFLDWESNSWLDRSERFYMAFAVGCFTAVLISAYIGLITTLIGVIERVRFGRNILSGLVQSAVYASGFFILWTLVSTAILVAGHVGLNDFKIAEEIIGIDNELVAAAVWIALIILGAAGFALRLARAPAALRYARR